MALETLKWSVSNAFYDCAGCVDSIGTGGGLYVVNICSMFIVRPLMLAKQSSFLYYTSLYNSLHYTCLFIWFVIVLYTLRAIKKQTIRGDGYLSQAN
jgi:hypothetical protein